MLKKRKVSKLAEGVWSKQDFLERIDIIYLEYAHKNYPYCYCYYPLEQ